MRLHLSTFENGLALEDGGGTFGFLRFLVPMDGILGFFTVERAWAHNQPNLSCVPPGFYTLEDRVFSKWGQRFALHGETVGIYDDGTAQRFACLFHPANWPHQVEGCIGLGRSIAWIKGSRRPKMAVTSSAGSVKLFEQILRAEEGPHSIVIERAGVRWNP